MLSNETMREYTQLQHRMDALQDTYEEALAQWQHRRAARVYSRILEVEQRIQDIETPEILGLHEYQNPA